MYQTCSGSVLAGTVLHFYLITGSLRKHSPVLYDRPPREVCTYHWQLISAVFRVMNGLSDVPICVHAAVQPELW